MGKKYLLPLLLLFTLVLAACAGTNSDTQEKKEQYIAITDAADGETIKTLNTDEAIEDFINKLALENWKIESLPSDTQAERKFILNQSETIKLGQDKDDLTLSPGAELISYGDAPYVTLDIKGFQLTFAVPQTTADYLHNL